MHFPYILEHIHEIISIKIISFILIKLFNTVKEIHIDYYTGLSNTLYNILLSRAFGPIKKTSVDINGICSLTKRKSVKWI